jgi:hypothetical protein
LDTFPETDYTHARDIYMRYWEQVEREFELSYFPNVTMGWDPSPRTVQSDAYLNAGYPFTTTLANNTPQRFAEALLLAKRRLEQRPVERRILTLNAWNEWTEGSYLEPDTTWGTAYLKAIQATFR